MSLPNLSEISKKIKIKQIIAILTLIIPLNVYVIGDFLGSGIQTPFFRFQTTYIGDSLIFSMQDLNYIVSGLLKGRSAFSGFLWIIGLCFLVLAVLLLFINLKSFKETKRYSGIVVVLSGILFLTSIIIQYGIFFYGPSGIAIPIGLPVLFVIGYWIYMEGRMEGENHGTDDKISLDEEAE